MNNRERNVFNRGLAIGLSQQQMSTRQISRQINVHYSTISRWIVQYNTLNKKAPTKQAGRPSCTTVRSNRFLYRLAARHNLASAKELRIYWQAQASLMTVYRRLRSIGLRKRRRAKVPYLSRENITSRLQWCMARVIWRAIWDRIVFSDESRFRRRGNDGRILVWRRRRERFLPENVTTSIQCGGGSVHVWAAIWKDGRSEVVFLRQNVNRHTYIETLRGFFQDGHLPNDFIFQDDNAPAHQAADVRDFFQTQGIRRLPWPSKSPDLNPIEHVWDHIKWRLNSRPQIANSTQQLENWISEEWRQMSQEFINNLIDSMPRRVRSVIEARGGHTRY